VGGYKMVFESTLAQAALIWIVVLLVECVVGFTLAYGAVSLGARLDERFDLAFLPRTEAATAADFPAPRYLNNRSPQQDPSRNAPQEGLTYAL
jgi:hypothetical protein